MKIKADYISPIIMEERKLNIAPMDVFSRLLMDRIVFLGCEINDDVANIIQAQLLYLDSINTDPIKMYINSPGGVVSAGLAIYDTMQLIKSPVDTVCTGMAASMAAILLSAGTTRSALPHSRVMIHQPSGGAYGQATDILIEAEEIRKCKEESVSLLSKHTGQSKETLYEDMERDKWFSAEEALKYGLIDKILVKK